MSEIDNLRAERDALQKAKAEIDEKIKYLEEAANQRAEDVKSLFHRMDSLILTSKASFTDHALGDVKEYTDEKSCAEAHMRTIDVEVSARSIEGDNVCKIPLDALPETSYIDDPTLVVSFLIPFSEIKDDPFFAGK